MRRVSSQQSLEGVGVRAKAWLGQCLACASGLRGRVAYPRVAWSGPGLGTPGGDPRGGSKTSPGRMTPASAAGLSIEEFISTFVTYKYIRLRHPQWLGLTHFVLRLLLIVGYSACHTPFP